MVWKNLLRPIIIFLSSVLLNSTQALADVENCGWGSESGEWECFSPTIIDDLKPIVGRVKYNCSWLEADAKAAEPPIHLNPDIIEALEMCQKGYDQMFEGINWCDLESVKIDTPRDDAETMCGEDICDGLNTFIAAHKMAYSFDIGKKWRASSESVNVTLVGVSQACPK